MTHPPAVQVQIPEAIASAAQALLSPYLDLNALLNNQQSNTPDQGGPGKKYFSIKEAVEYSSVSRYTLFRAAKKNELSVQKIQNSPNGKILISIKELDRWINRNNKL